MKKLLTISMILFALPAQAQYERVVTDVKYWVYDSLPNRYLADSVRYAYTGGNHSFFDYNELQYLLGDLQAVPLYWRPTLFEMPASLNNYDSSRTLVQYDTLSYYAPDFVSGILQGGPRAIAKHNANGAFQFQALGGPDTTGGFYVGEKIVLVYDWARLIKAYDLVDYGNPTLDTEAIRTISYYSSGQVRYDSVQLPGLPQGYKTSYDYNAAGDCTSYYTGASKNFEYDFYPNHQLHTINYYWFDGSGRHLGRKDSFTYAAGVPGYKTFYELHYDSTGALAQMYVKDASHINAQLRKDSVTQFRGLPGALEAIASFKVSYDALANPVSRIDYLVTDSASYPQRLRLWTYEPYTPTSIQPVTTAPSLISLSPNPVSSALTLHYKSPLPNTPITVSISNTAGQILHSETFIPKGDNTDITLGDEVPPGLYAISVFGSSNSVHYKGTFLKQ